jgi:transcriptional regulator with XRE-family HTH domain
MPGGRGEDERNMFAAELIAMLNQRGWTQEETAAKMLVSASTVANIKSGGTGEAAGGACARTGMSSANG